MSQLEGKEKILSVATDLIMKHGYNEVSVRRIAREAKISIGTLYYHFPNGKVSILYDIMESFSAEFMEMVDFSDFEQLLKNPTKIKEYLNESMVKIREIAPLIRGFEVELLSNKDVLANAKEIMQQREEKNRANIELFIKTHIPRFEGKERLLTTFGKLFVNTIYIQTILDKFYGPDDDLIDVLIKIVNGFFNIE